MKALFILIFSLNVLIVSGQKESLSPINDLVVSQSIQLAQSKSSSFTSALIWIAESFGDANEVIKLKDKEEGIIVIKGLTDLYGFNTSFTMSLLFEGEELNVLFKNFEETKYGYNTRNWGVKPNACYTNLCKKNYSKWSSNLENIAETINTSLISNLK